MLYAYEDMVYFAVFQKLTLYQRCVAQQNMFLCVGLRMWRVRFGIKLDCDLREYGFGGYALKSGYVLHWLHLWVQPGN
jgi:hypothetical protein